MESTLTVERNVEGKFGPQLKGTDGSFYSFGKFYKGPKEFESGAVLSVELYVTESGNKYINKVLNESQNVPVVAYKEPVKEVVKRGRPKKETSVDVPVSRPVNKQPNWDAIALGKTRCLAMTQLLSSILPMVVTNPQNMDEVKQKAKELADFAVEYSFSDEA